MGSIFSFIKGRRTHTTTSRSCSTSTNTNTNVVTPRTKGLSYLPQYYPTTMSKEPSSVSSSSTSTSSSEDKVSKLKKQNTRQKYAFIADNFSSLDQVTAALREAGLESSNLIVGIDFTKSNEWTGNVSFNNRSLHAIGDTPNPYEKAISIIGKTLAPFDEDNLIPCFGFGDATTHDQEVFSFHSDHSPCHGFEEVMACYKTIVPNLRLAGPTSYAPVIEAAVDIVEKSGGQYHVLVIVADGQVEYASLSRSLPLTCSLSFSLIIWTNVISVNVKVTRSINTSDRELSPQEDKTIKSIVNASSYPLSIVLVGVGDGPWDDMKKFDDKLPAREFDNFQFVNFTEIMSKNTSESDKELAFALAALMEIPLQYKAAVEFGIIGHTTGRAKKVVPRPPPVPYTRRAIPDREPSNAAPQPSDTASPNLDDRTQACPICLTNRKDMAFACGHMTCRDCSTRLTNCPICRQRITSRIRLYA